ncbi:MAG: class II glutamine amidotransferase, partial [Omnitrophica bacterium]|nr:class II glutamine amidotransferase [Candidatus Omnitrophota bacterium]
MCGIIGYTGKKDAATVLMGGLKRLEYRGYDSAGLAIVRNGSITSSKEPGKLQVLANELKHCPLKGNTGIGHSRWATHGIPNKINAHPHLSSSGKIAVVHNGIIENHQHLKRELLREGHAFVSDTDTEIIPNLIAKFYRGDLLEAVRRSVGLLR